MPPRRTTLRDVAARAGVSPTTVSLVLNQKPINVPAETRERVFAAAADLHYAPNALVRSLQAGRTGTLGVYVEFRASVWQNAFVGALVDGLRRGAEDAGCDVLFYRPPADPAPGSPSPAATLMDGRADAAVLWLATDAFPLQALATNHFPAVVLMHDAVPPPLTAVLADERRGAGEVVDHLLSLGHRDVAYYAGGLTPLPPHLRLRRDAFLAAAEAGAIPVSPSHVLIGPAGALTDLMSVVAGRMPARPTAIVCAHEELAYRTLDRAAALGVRIPEDLSVVSWELSGPPEGRQSLRPPTNPAAGTAQAWLTGVRVPIWEMGRAAAEAAVRASVSGRATHGSAHTFASTLQVGHSTGPAPPILPS